MGSRYSRRTFLHNSVASSLVGAISLSCGKQAAKETTAQENTKPSDIVSLAKVAIVRCRSYGEELLSAYKSCFDFLGGIGSLVKGKTVTIKINLTGSPYQDAFGRIAAESYITHGNTAIALTSILFEEGAKRVRIVECANYREDMKTILDYASWDVPELMALGKVELENTRNLGSGKQYVKFQVPNEGHLFSSFELNHSYADTDVFISLTKLKNHSTAGVTLAMKNLFGITPNALYGEDAGSERAIRGRSRVHRRGGGWGRRWRRRQEDEALHLLPGEKETEIPNRQEYRVPRTIVDLNSVRPVHLSIIDGITSMSGGEGPLVSSCIFH
jgi:uncharacterized protein (DUF362 family)